MATDEAPQTQTMYGPDGQAVEVPLDQVRQAYHSGKLGFAEGQPVYLQKGQEVVALDGAKAGELFDSGLANTVRLAGEGDFAKQEEAKEYSGALRGLEAAAYGGARGLTLGGSDWVASQLGGEQTAEHMRKLEEHRPVASLVGEGVGIGLPLLFTGGSSGVGLAARGAEAVRGAGLGLLGRGAEIATALPRGVGALGRGAEGIAARGLAEAGLAETGLASRTMRAATGAAVEGALYGVGQEVSEASLRNEEITAEKLLAAAGHGALLGGVLGGSLTVAGAALRGAVSKAEEAGKGLLGRVAKREEALTNELAAAAPKAESTIKILAQKAEVEYTIKALGATPQQVDRLVGMGDDIVTRAVRMANEDTPKLLGKSELAFLPMAKKAEAAVLLEKKAGKAIGDIIDELSQASIKPDIAAVTSRVFREKLVPLAEEFGPKAKKAMKEGKKILAELDEKLEGQTVKDLWNAKRSIGEDVNWVKLGRGEGSRVDKLKADIYRSLDAEIKRVGEAASAELGEGVAARWANANREYRAATWLKQTTEKGAHKAAAAEGPLTRMSGTLETAASVGLAAMTGGVWAVPMLVGSKLAAHVARTYGQDAAAKIAGAASRGEMVKGIEGALDKQLGQKVAGLFGRTAEGVQKTPLLLPAATALERETGRREPKGKLAVRYQAKRDQVAQFLAAPEAHVAAATRGLAQVPVGVREHLAKKAIVGAQFLQGKAPVRDPDPLQPHLSVPAPSPQEMDRYLRYAKALDAPLSVLDDALAGKLSREAVEALKTVYPHVYDELRAQVTAQLVETRKPLPYQERLQLNILLDVPTDRTLEPQFVQALQKAYASLSQGQGQGAPAPGSGQGPRSLPSHPVQIAKAYETKASGLEGPALHVTFRIPSEYDFGASQKPSGCASDQHNDGCD